MPPAAAPAGGAGVHAAFTSPAFAAANFPTEGNQFAAVPSRPVSLSGVHLHEAPARWTRSSFPPGNAAAASASRPFASATNIHDSGHNHTDDGDLHPDPPAGFRTWALAGSRSHGPTHAAAAAAVSPSHNSSSGGIGRWGLSGARKHEVDPERAPHPYPPGAGEPPLPASGGSWQQLRSPLQRSDSWASPRQSLNGAPQVAAPPPAAAANKTNSSNNLGGYSGASTAPPMVAGGASRRWRLSRLGKQVQPTLKPPPPTQQQQQHYQEQEQQRQQRATGGRISPVNGQSAAALRSGTGGNFSDNGDNDALQMHSAGASDEEHEDGAERGTGLSSGSRSTGALGGYPAAAAMAGHLAPRGVLMREQGSSPLQSAEGLVSAARRSGVVVDGRLSGCLDCIGIS